MMAVVFLAGPRRPKRTSGHDLYRTYNDHGEWSIRVEPGGLQIDNYHSRGGTPHIHHPRHYEETDPLPGLTEERAWSIVWKHLETHGRIVYRRLIKELRQA